MKEDYNPLVTIGVLTYNSAKYVLETLESAKAQTYKNIELIISDDCSTDNTVELCRNWVAKNKDRFARCEILTVEKNTGIPANCNRRLRASKGEWIKGIAGDDILAPDCIENFINFVKQNPEAEWVNSQVQYFQADFKPERFGRLLDESYHSFYNENKTPQEQYRILLRGNPIHAPGVFVKKALLNSVGGYDERFSFIEDHPVWLKLTKSGKKCFYMKKRTIFYRLHDSSIFATRKPNTLFNSFYKKRLNFDKEYRLPFLGIWAKLLYYKNYYLCCCMDKFGLNKSNFLCRALYWGGHPILVLRFFFRKVFSKN
ncbi:MAG: glycosyltransferase [Verrucomicrobia bacterium]|nr:glycosyltransferase [Verrucomicrobiota bacterium]